MKSVNPSMQSPPPLAAPEPGEDVLVEIFRDMMKLSDADFASLRSLSREGGGSKTIDQLAVEKGHITVEQRDTFWRAYMERRLDEMRQKLLGARIGSYQILEEIAAGGMGIVFKARQESPMFTRETALKFMLAGAEAGEEDRERFIAEVKGLASLSHPCLVHILDSGIEGDLYYFSMELVDGWSLDDAEGAKALSSTRKVEAVRDIARALAYLHSSGVVHRDVKPGNIMVDRQGAAKLLDFGIAQFSADPRRRAVQAGTPYFMAPEVIAPTGGFGPIGPGTDVYALGAVLYQLLFSRPVFDSPGGLGEVLAKTVHEPPRFPRRRGERIPLDLERIISRCLKKRVSERYASAKDLAEDLETFLRRGRYKVPLWTATAAAGFLAVVLILLAKDRETPLSAAPRAFADLQPWKERMREIEEVDPEAARPLAEKLKGMEAEDVSETAFSTGLRELFETRSTFWRERVQQEVGRTVKAKQAYLEVQVRAPRGDQRLEKLFGDGQRNLDQARTRKPDRTAFDLLQTARASFEEARRLAEAQRLETQRNAEKDDAGAVRKKAIEAQRELEETHQTAFAEDAAKARETATAQMQRGDEQMEAGDFQKARALFAEAERGYYSAKARGKVGFEAKRALLSSALERALDEHDRMLPRLERNLSAADVKEIGRTREKASEAAKEGRLLDLESLLAAHEKALAEATKQVDGLERAAAEARTGVRAIAPGERVPAALKLALTKTLAVLAEGENRFKAGELEAARGAFEKAAASFDGVRSTAAKLTEGMAWVQGDGETSGFWIDRREVSVDEYRKLRRHPPASWEEQLSHPDWPVVGVSLDGARSYARSKGKDLPTEAQWRLAALRGKDGRPHAYPYGDAFDPTRVNGAGAGDGFPGLAPVGSLPAGASACGCLHLTGNAAEWVLTPAGEGVLLGGSYLTGEPTFLRGDARYALRGPFEEDASARKAAGFRCVLAALREEPGR